MICSKGTPNRDACSSAWTLGKFWALREAMKPQRVGTVGGRGESRYLRGRRGRQQAWWGGGGTGRGAPTGQDGPAARQAQFPGHSVTRRSHTRLSPLGWEDGKQITYHPHWGTAGEDGHAVQ